LNQVTELQIRTDLATILSKLAGLGAERIRGEDRLREDLGLDSLRSMELLARIADRYEVELRAEDVVDVETVGDVVSLLLEHIRSGGRQ